MAPTRTGKSSQHSRSPRKTWVQSFFVGVTILGSVAAIVSHLFAIRHSAIPSTSTAADWLHAFLPSIETESQQFRRTPPEIPATGDPGTGYNGTTYHVIFSTSCHDQMHWEAYMLFYHAMKARQPGNVTRIASGCSEEEATQLHHFHENSIKSMSDRFHLHLTEDFGHAHANHGSNAGRYKYFNKAFGVLSFLENVLHMNSTERQAGVEDGIIILLDPDMILLRPLLHDFSNEDVLWVTKTPLTKVVKHGFPIAQQDGYLGNEWRNYDSTYIIHGDKKSTGVKIQTPDAVLGPTRWNTGPPYLATVKDMYDIAKLWIEYGPRTYALNPKAHFAEMYGFIWATVKLNLPHSLIKSLVVSTTETRDREGWKYIDNLTDDQVCLPPKGVVIPNGIHYCQRHGLGSKYFFSKYRIKKNIMDCSQNLMARPPPGIGKQFKHWIKPPQADGVETKERFDFNWKRAKREEFMLCGLINGLNDAMIYYKTHNCEHPNLNETYTVYNSPKDY